MNNIQSPWDKMDNPIVLGMCMTYRHDFGLERETDEQTLGCGMTLAQRKSLYRDMYQLWDHNIKPHTDKMEKELDQLIDENVQLCKQNEKLLSELHAEQDKVVRYQNNGNFY